MEFDYSKQKHIIKIPPRLQITSFFCGAAVMILELAGSRIVAPFFGTSLIVWTALIGVIMTSLAIGNWLGGQVADKRPEGRLLGRILLISAIIIALTAFFSNLILTQLSEVQMNLYVSSVMSALIIFTPSSVLLGMTSPFIARLAMLDVKSSGGIVGKLSALNSAGSILGTFLGGFVLISLFPSGIILMLLACGLALLSVLIYTGYWLRIISVIVLAILGTGTFFAEKFGLPFTPIGEQIDTQYNHLSVAESIDRRNNRRVRVLITNPDCLQSLMYTDAHDELVSDYTKFYDLAFHYKPDTKKVLMLGGGGYCVPRHILHTRPDVSIDVVELDPGVTEVAREYFYLKDSDNLRIFHEDARTFLNREGKYNPGQYDAIFMDTFGSWIVIPFHMTTVETAMHLKELLKPGGVLIVNTISSVRGPKAGVFNGIYKAFQTAFPTMMIFPATAPDPRYAFSQQNIMLVAMADASLNNLAPVTSDSEFADLLSHQWLEPFVPDSHVPAFTDAFAPVEKYALMQ